MKEERRRRSRSKTTPPVRLLHPALQALEPIAVLVRSMDHIWEGPLRSLGVLNNKIGLKNLNQVAGRSTVMAPI